MSKKKRNFKSIVGHFIPLPRIFLRSKAYASLSPYANKLFSDLLSQYNGFNNGDLSCAWKTAKMRGWKSRSTIDKSFAELLAAKLIIKTRQGGRNMCNLYAITLFHLDDCNGKLDYGMKATNSPIGGWAL